MNRLVFRKIIAPYAFPLTGKCVKNELNPFKSRALFFILMPDLPNQKGSLLCSDLSLESALSIIETIVRQDGTETT
jgi:hypothetical protein